MRGCCFEMSPISAEAKFPKVVHHQKWPAKSLVSVGSIRNLEHHMRSIYIYIHIYISDIIYLKLIKFKGVSFLFLVVAFMSQNLRPQRRIWIPFARWDDLCGGSHGAGAQGRWANKGMSGSSNRFNVVNGYIYIYETVGENDDD